MTRILISFCLVALGNKSLTPLLRASLVSVMRRAPLQVTRGTIDVTSDHDDAGPEILMELARRQTDASPAS